MKILLDTCAFIWITTDAPELSLKARDVFQNPENEVFLSSVSVWISNREQKSMFISVKL